MAKFLEKMRLKFCHLFIYLKSSNNNSLEKKQAKKLSRVEVTYTICCLYKGAIDEMILGIN